MRQLFLDSGALAVREVCQPALDDYSVLVSVSYSFMSSGDGLAKILNDRDNSILNKMPNKVKKIAELVSSKGLQKTSLIIKDRLAGRVFNLGHSCSGVVIAVGVKVQAIRVGDFVACAGTDFANHADIVCVPQHLVARVKKEEDVCASSLTGVGVLALNAVQRANLELGQTVAVFGLDTIGQITIKLCQAAGCHVIGIDTKPELLKKAQVAGARYVYDISQDNVSQIIEVLTDYSGIDCAIVTPDFTDRNHMGSVMNIVKRKGRVVLTSGGSFDLPSEEACAREIDVAFAASYGPGLYNFDTRAQSEEQKVMTTFVDLIAANKLDVSDFIQNKYSLSELNSAIDRVKSKKSLGVVIDFDSHQKLRAELDLLQKSGGDENTFIPAKLGNQIKIGVMGVSRATRLNKMPILANVENSVINTLVDLDVSRSLNAARLYKGANALAGSLSTFRNDDSNVIFVSEVADINVDDVISLLSQGKALFIERQFIENSEQLEKLESYLKQNPNSILCVGYSRRYSVFMQKVKKHLDKRTSPFMLNYRVNLGVMTDEQKFVGAWRFGSIVSYVSHILDTFCFFAGAKPKSVSVDSVRTSGESILSADNFTATVSFADGSVCSLNFTTLGNPEMGKERMELFFDSKTIVMNDYKNLIGYGVAPYFDEKDKEPDFGMDQMLQEFFVKLHEGENLISIDDLIDSTKLMLAVDKMVY